MKVFILGFALMLGMPMALASERTVAEPPEAELAAAEARASLEQAITSAIQRLEEQLAQNEGIREEIDQAAEEVRQAQQEWRQSSGALARMVALDGLRTARQNHHQAARQLKESRQQLSQALQKVAREAARLERGMQEQAGRIASEKALAATDTVQQLEKIRNRHEELREQTEKRLEQLAPLIRRQMEMDQGSFGPGPEPPRWDQPPVPPRPGMAPPEAPDSPESPPGPWWPREDRQRRRGGWPFLQQHQQKMEAMEQRIQELEQEVKMFEKRLQRMEAREGGGRRARPPSR